MNKWVKAASLGGLTGMRSTFGLRSAGHSYGYGQYNSWFSRLILGEALMDKMPFMPSRASAMPLISRAALGGLAGTGVAHGRRWSRERLLFGALGAASAVAASFALSALRTRIARKSRVASTVVGLAEDTVVLVVSRRIEAA